MLTKDIFFINMALLKEMLRLANLSNHNINDRASSFMLATATNDQTSY